MPLERNLPTIRWSADHPLSTPSFDAAARVMSSSRHDGSHVMSSSDGGEQQQHDEHHVAVAAALQRARDATQSPPSSPSHRPNFWKECDQRCSKRRRRCSSSREEGGHGPCRPRATSLQCPLMTLGGQREKRCTPRWRISRQWASADNMRTVCPREALLPHG